MGLIASRWPSVRYWWGLVADRCLQSIAQRDYADDLQTIHRQDRGGVAADLQGALRSAGERFGRIFTHEMCVTDRACNSSNSS